MGVTRAAAERRQLSLKGGRVAQMDGAGSQARRAVVLRGVAGWCGCWRDCWRDMGSCGAVWSHPVRQQSEDQASPENRRAAAMGAGQADGVRTSMRQGVCRAQRVQGLRWCQERGRSMVVVSKVICGDLSKKRLGDGWPWVLRQRDLRALHASAPTKRLRGRREQSAARLTWTWSAAVLLQLPRTTNHEPRAASHNPAALVHVRTHSLLAAVTLSESGLALAATLTQRSLFSSAFCTFFANNLSNTSPTPSFSPCHVALSTPTPPLGLRVGLLQVTHPSKFARVFPAFRAPLAR